MNINLHIQADSPEELNVALTRLGGLLGGSSLEQIAVTANVAKEEPKEQKPVKQEATKPEKQADPQPVQKSVSVETNESSDPVKIPSVADLRAVAQEKGKTAEGKKAIKEILNEFGCKAVSDVPEEQRAAFLSTLEAL